MKAVPASLRVLNQRRILERLNRSGPASRASLAEEIGISRPTAGKIIDELLAAGVLEERNEAENHVRGVGRPGRPVGLESRTRRLLLIELGVRHTSLAAVPLACTDAAPWTHVFATPTSAGAWQAALEAGFARLGVSPWAFAVSVPGAVDEAAGRVLYSPNLHWLEGAEPLALVGGVVASPGTLVQEVRALALGHHIDNPGDDDFLWVDAEDGVGGAALFRGQPFEGTGWAAGELGHTPLPGNDRLCGCGARGCLETVLSRQALVRSVLGDDGDWAALLQQLARASLPARVRAHLEAGAGVIAGALNVLGLSRVYLSGALGELPEAGLTLVAQAIRANVLAARFGEVTVRAAERRRARGLVTACLSRVLAPREAWS